jgi:hypothetical protein
MKPSKNYYIVEPEVAGDLGDDTELDSSVHPPLVTRLHYEFEVWLGDALLESFPCFIVTEAARSAIEATQLTGARFEDLKVTTSDVFDEMYPQRKLPKFSWLQIEGMKGKDDFSLMPDGRLVVSEKALAVLRKLGISHAEVQEA